MVRSLDAGIEKEFQLEDSLRTVHVLVRGHAADRRFVEADVFGDLLENQRPEILHALFKELLLELDDAADDLDDGFVALLNAANDPLRTAQLLLDIGLRAVALPLAVAEQLLVIGGDP